MKVKFEFNNIDEAQALALESLFAQMQHLGNVGGSRWVCFYSDGDGNFRPQIKRNGKKVKLADLINHKSLWINGEYRIDCDALYP